MSVSLRAARPDDDVILARLWVQTFPDKFGPLLGRKAEGIITDWFRLSQRHMETTTVAEIDGVAVGYIVLHTPTTPALEDEEIFWQALRLHYSWWRAGWRILLLSWLDSDYPMGRNEIYIEMVGVDPAWRGQGIATELLAYAESVAREERAKAVSLSVLCNNQTAIRLYQKHGFHIMQTQHNFVLRLITGEAGYHEMVKGVEGRR